MIRIKITSNSSRKTVTAQPNQTIAEILEDNNISFAGAALHLDGSLVMPDELDETLEDLGIEDETEVALTSIVKADSAF